MTNILRLTSCKNDIFCSALTSCSGTMWLASALFLMSRLCTCTADSMLRQGDTISSPLLVLTTHCITGQYVSPYLTNGCLFPIRQNNKPHNNFYTWTNILAGRIVHFLRKEYIYSYNAQVDLCVCGCYLLRSLQKLHELRTY